jgi:hypothetical protein
MQIEFDGAVLPSLVLFIGCSPIGDHIKIELISCGDMSNTQSLLNGEAKGIWQRDGVECEYPLCRFCSDGNFASSQVSNGRFVVSKSFR